MKQPPLILAIDDDPGRYSYLAHLIDQRPEPRPTLVVATCRSCVEQHLAKAAVVLLDFDLDGFEECVSCKGWIDVSKSTEYVEQVTAACIPVIMTSCSRPQNRAWLASQLESGNVKFVRNPADHMGVELEWLGQLWTWGII